MKSHRRMGHQVLLLVALGVISPPSLTETPGWTSASSAAAAERQSALASGTIEALDTKLSTIKIRTDTGKGLELKVTKPDLLQGLTVGDRVTAELDREGRANKIMKAALPELPSPPAAKP